MELNLESTMFNDYFKPLNVIIALPLGEICCLEYIFLFQTCCDPRHGFPKPFHCFVAVTP